MDTQDSSTNPDINQVVSNKWFNNKERNLIISFLILALFLVTVRSVFVPSSSFNVGSSIEVEYGDSLMTISEKLYDAGVIESIPVFQFFVVLYGNDKSILAGSYYFDRPISTINVALRMVRGDYNKEEIRVTFPEGMTVYEMSNLLDKKISNFNREKFLEIAEAKEGYLFPDTYFISPSADEEDIINQLEKNFERRISEIEEKFLESEHSLEDIIIMASIIEKEASGDDDRSVISGILWKRIRIGMALQVDATLTYITGKDSSELTLSDLDSKSPFNTYENKGLPPAPISNPGILSIVAALEPTESPYLYYLHDSNGDIHYARNFEEHKQNKALYLQ